MLVTAVPLIEDNKIRLNELPNVSPYPFSKGSAIILAYDLSSLNLMSSLEGFIKMKNLGVTTMTIYPWMLYGIMNEAPLKEKIDAMEKFYNEIVVELE